MMPFFGSKLSHRLDEPDGADGDQVLLVVLPGVIFFYDVGHQPQVVLDEDLAGGGAAPGQLLQVLPLLGGGQRLGKLPPPVTWRKKAHSPENRSKSCAKRNMLPLPFLSLPYLYERPGEKTASSPRLCLPQRRGQLFLCLLYRRLPGEDHIQLLPGHGPGLR